MKRSRLYAVLALLILISQVASADLPVTLMVDGKRLPTSPAPVLRGGRVYVPVTVFRPIGLGVTIESSRVATVHWPESSGVIVFEAGSIYSGCSGPLPFTVKLPGAPFVRRGVLMVPLRALPTQWDHELTAIWDARSRTVDVRRSREWLRWRFELDDDIIENTSGEYSHVFIGNYVPPRMEIERAEKLDASGEWFDAAKVLRSLISAKPFTWESDAWRIRDEWKAYQPLGRILVREQPEGANGHYYLAIGLAVEGQYAAAEEEFRRATEIDPSRADAHFGAGWAVLRQEKAGTAFDRDPETLRKALADFDRALVADPTHEPALRAGGYAWLALAYVENQQGGYTYQSKAQVLPYLNNAIDCFERLLRVEGPSPQMSELIQHIRDQLD